MKKIIITLIQIFLLAIIFFSAYKIGNYYLQRYQANKNYSIMQRSVDEIRKPKIEKDQEGKAASLEDETKEVFAYFKGLNKDIVSYISIEGTTISYPILQSNDNDYYLWRGVDKKENIQGSLFMDYRSNPSYEDKNTIIYGHLMKRGDMFSPLKNFYDQDFVNSSPQTVELIYEGGILKGRIFAIMEIPVDRHDDILFSQKENWPNFLEELRNNSSSKFSYKEKFEEDDRIVSLSTCVESLDDNYRTIVFVVIK